MQNTVVHIIEELEGTKIVDSCLSFRGFINYLKERRREEKTMRVKYLDFVIHHFEQRLQGKDILSIEEMKDYDDLLELIYSSVFPALVDENESLWALSVPVTPTIFYGTEPFYDLLRDPASKEVKACMMEKMDKVRKKVNFELVYSLILRKLYNINLPAGNSVIRSWKDDGTGLSRFYRLNIDTRFIEVVPKGTLPDIDHRLFNSHLPTSEIIAWLMEHLPLSMVRFEGIAAITLTDVTEEYVVDSIKNIILNPPRCEDMHNNKGVIHYLEILGGKSDLHFGLLPFLKVNGRPVFSDVGCEDSVLGEVIGDDWATAQTYVKMVEDYFLNPQLLVYETLPAHQPGEPFFLEPLRQHGIKGYGLIPVFYNNRLAGVLEVASRKDSTVDHDLLTRLDAVLPLLAQILQRSIDEFDARIKSVVKENFTSIQPAVEWKFNEAAWNYERVREVGEYPPVIETISFKNVYPLYGAIDIRNSTVERNSALRRDLQVQFDILTSTLASLQQAVNLQLLEELLFQARKWQKALAGALTTADELNLNTFLKDKIGAFLEHFKDSRPEIAELVAPYLQAIDEESGVAFAHRRDLETSIQLVNKTINRHLEQATDELQRSYPSYFEKFRTDGIEYDIYIGQSIAPDHPFDLLYLRNLRLWQLSSMTVIARLTNALLPQMPERLLTTQLIFVHSSAIDISFRKDERRFDVDGGYNIRYQVVKKRIDKVHVRDTNERLTQPGKIAIIYLNEREADEYRGYIRYLQEKGMLGAEVENLDLEELQGVSGLRALRVSVKMEESVSEVKAKRERAEAE
ncbi:MAG: GAF domain-containing protein [Bacteroidetes bacterium]|nr:GAF domain-containing protein [Bacteroidota bacterium]